MIIQQRLESFFLLLVTDSHQQQSINSQAGYTIDYQSNHEQQQKSKPQKYSAGMQSTCSSERILPGVPTQSVNNWEVNNRVTSVAKTKCKQQVTVKTDNRFQLLCPPSSENSECLVSHDDDKVHGV